MPEFGIPREKEFRSLLEIRLPQKTFSHVVSVAETMVNIHEQAGIQLQQAVTAGLLHDVCKAMQKEELTELAVAYGIKEFLEIPNLLHGPVGAEYCRRELDIVDEDVLDAIRFHTSGKSNWNAVGCALYIADFCEPGRPYPEAAFAQQMMTEQGFAPTLHFVAKTKTDHVRNIHDIDPNSEAFLRWIQTEYPV